MSTTARGFHFQTRLAEEKREPADPLADSLTAHLRRDSAGSRRRQCGDSILTLFYPAVP
jgi:hypothetical protein